MKILGFSGGNSKKSIDISLLNYAASLFENARIKLIDLNDYEVELYSIDREIENDIPSVLEELTTRIDEVDLLLISLAEHNGTYSAAFKNMYAWLSRVLNRKVFNEKPILLLVTSSGGIGAADFLEDFQIRFSRDGSEVLGTFLLPNFQDNFDDSEITTIKFRTELIRKVNKIKYNSFKMHYKDDSFTCGIDPKKDDCGDAIEY